MKRFVLVIAVLLAAVSVQADRLADVIDVTPTKGWVRARPKRGANAPTLRFVPSDGRNAEVLISLIPSQKPVDNADALTRLHQQINRSTYGNAPVKVKELRYETKDSVGIYTTFEDPDLVGKPTKPGDFKYATSVLASLGQRYLIVGTVFTDNPQAPEQDEGLEMVKSAAIVAGANPAPTERPAPFGVAQLNYRLTAPVGFAPTGENPRNDPKYFYYRGPSGLLLSGWLDRANNYVGFKKFWSHEKAALTRGPLTVVEKEFKRIGEWDAVLYSVALPGRRAERNLRACRVAGNTWFDVHLSIGGGGDDWTPLESALQAIVIAPKETM